MRAFRYFPANSFLHSLNPSIKLLALALVTIVLTFVYDVATPLAFWALCLLALILLGHASIAYIARSLLPLLVVALGFVVTNVLFHRDLGVSTPLLTLGPIIISLEGLELGLSIGLRVLFMASTSLLFVATTRPGDFVLSLIQQARLNYKLAFAVLAAYRFIPIFAEEYANIRAAGRVRGLETAGPLGAMRSVRRDAVPLLAGAIRRSERLAVAMDSRAFGAYPNRTYRKELRIGLRDWLFLVATLTVSAALLLALIGFGLLGAVGVQ